MKLKKLFCLLLTCIFAFGCLAMDAGAAQVDTEDVSVAIERASGRFSMDIGKQSTFTADSDFFLDVGETVTITATYTPRSASVDFGLIAPNGLFYSLPGQRGSFSETFKIDQRGYYTLAIRNNSDFVISVSGTVTY